MPGASSTSRWQEDSVPLSRVRSMCAGAGMSLWMPYSAREDPEPLAVPQLVDPDAFLCRQVGISFHIERDTFSLVMNLNTSSHGAGAALLFRTRAVYHYICVSLLWGGVVNADCRGIPAVL